MCASDYIVLLFSTVVISEIAIRIEGINTASSLI